MTYTIIVEPEALNDLQNIIGYITRKDSKLKAVTFADELKKAVSSLSEMPMRCRKSHYLEDDNAHDLIHKGYTIVFKIIHENVYILSIFRQKAY